MEEVGGSFIPVSHLSLSGRISGFIHPWASQCQRCDRQCERTEPRSSGICSYGINFYRISKEILLFGFIVQGATLNQTQRKALKQNRQSVVSPEMIGKILRTFQTHEQSLMETKAAAIQRSIEEYRTSIMYKTELLNLLKPDIQKNLAFLHDYKQFVARVKQNINVVLQERFPNEPIDSQLNKVSRAEAAIYWAAALIDDRLQNTYLLMNPDRLSGAAKAPFRLHGFILKHLRIYQAAFDEKGIRVTQTGYSAGEITASQAFAAIPHAFLDNALKYSSRGCQVVIAFREDRDSIDFSVTSHGPKIEDEEKSKIFESFYRGKNGIAQQEEGSGVGLYLAQFVARDLGTEVKVVQSPQKTKWGYETTFSVCLRRSG